MPDACLAVLQEAPFDWLYPATPPKLINMFEKAGSFIEQLPLIQEFAGSLHIRVRRPSE